LLRGRKFLQIVPIAPDEEYTFGVNVDTSRMAVDYASASTGEAETQQLAIGMGFTDSSFRNITFLDPGSHETASSLQLSSYEPAAVYDPRVGFKIRSMGCGAHSGKRRRDLCRGVFPGGHRLRVDLLFQLMVRGER
jgi:hypothetical protein